VKTFIKSRVARLTLAVAILVLVPAAIAFAVGGNYTGTTSQGKKCGSKGKSKCTVKIHVINNAVQQDSHILWRAPCNKAKWLTGNTAFHGGLKKGNTFGVSGTYTETGLGSGVTAQVTAHLSFKVKSHSAPGSFHAKATVHSASGAVIDHCTTPQISFTAHK
jgi:hypothetical protein